MAVSADGIYARRSWGEEPPEWSYSGPFASYMERQTQQALTPMFMTREEIQQNVRQPLQQVAVFRPRMGYPEMQERQARVVDIVNQPRRLDARATWFSGGPAGFTGAPRYMTNSLGQV
jgi:hypothetical protein